ncbi:MAG TPA: hypothetical protein VGJ51_03350, partial [Candidatus Angelobacter sp.]
GNAAAQDSSRDEKAATQKLGALLGKWRSEGKFFDTPYSKGEKLIADLDCTWSPQSNFVICEQLVTDHNGKHKRLSAYSYNEREKNYDIRTMVEPGLPPFHAIFTIEGKIWTITSSRQAEGKKVEFRTIVDHSSPGVQLSKTEYSDDGGAHWMVMLRTTANRIAD